MAESYYDILGVKRDASTAQLKRAYKKLARKYHPDVNSGPEASAKFQKISEAYQVLSDTEKRRNYDQFGTAQPGFQNGARQGGFDFGNIDFGDIGNFGFGDAGEGRQRGGFRDVFSQIFGGGMGGTSRASRTRQAARGRDINTTLTISFFQSVNGFRTTLTMRRRTACESCGGFGVNKNASVASCSRCGGSGRVSLGGGALNLTRVCESCSGTGQVAGAPCSKCEGGFHSRDEKLTVRIPPGVDNGSRIRIAGKGDEGVSGGRPGDLVISFQVVPHEFFERKGDNIHVEVPISVSEAALGAKIRIPTLNGLATMKIPPNTQANQQFRLREKGAPSRRNGQKGDLFVKVNLVVPPAQDEKSRELYRELESLHPENPRAEIEERYGNPPEADSSS